MIPMTFSIVGRCPRTGQLGVAAATAMPAVGKFVSHAMCRTGAVASQAFINPYYGFDGLRLLGQGRDAKSVLDELLKNDPNRQKRQVGIIDRNGIATAWSGNKTARWSGDIVGEDFATQGNRLTGPEVLEATARAFRERSDLGLAERLLVSLEAGEQAGGDLKGEQSATLLVYESEEYPLWDVRVDDAPDPVKELRRLYHVFLEQLLPSIKKLPKRDKPEGQLRDEDQPLG
jgi:uncharacterized Ntn-hydrolase superfamily protein